MKSKKISALVAGASIFIGLLFSGSSIVSNDEALHNVHITNEGFRAVASVTLK